LKLTFEPDQGQASCFRLQN